MLPLRPIAGETADEYGQDHLEGALVNAVGIDLVLLRQAVAERKKGCGDLVGRDRQPDLERFGGVLDQPGERGPKGSLTFL